MRARLALLPLLLACGADPDEPADAPAGDGLVEQPDGTVSLTSDVVDGACVDGAWSEELADPTIDVSGVSFSAADPAAYLVDALALRWPAGAWILDQGRQSPGFGGGLDCVEAFTSPRQRGSKDGMLQAASTLVHECGHFLDIELGGFTSSAYVFTEDITLTCSGGSYNDTPARSRIRQDAWYELRPACPAQGSHGCDDYAEVYLDGDPDDRAFDSGDQGLDTVLEEALQYVHSLATEYAFEDRLSAGTQTSARDGILTFLWYIERYLHLLRTEHPRVYDEVLGRACWREMILSVWGRAWIYLETTEGIGTLGIDDGDLEELVRDPALLEEIQRVRDAEGC